MHTILHSIALNGPNLPDAWTLTLATFLSYIGFTGCLLLLMWLVLAGIGMIIHLYDFRNLKLKPTLILAGQATGITLLAVGFIVAMLSGSIHLVSVTNLTDEETRIQNILKTNFVVTPYTHAPRCDPFGCNGLSEGLTIAMPIVVMGHTLPDPDPSKCFHLSIAQAAQLQQALAASASPEDKATALKFAQNP